MAKFQPYKISSSQLSQLAKKEGQLILTTDTKKLYLDVDNSTRIIINADAVVGFSTSGKTITYTREDGTTGTFTTQDTTYPTASTSANGLMSKEDKTKLEGIAEGAQVNTITGVKGSSESSYRTGNINITKANIGLGNVENKNSATIRREITSANVTTALGYTPINSNLKGASNGLAELDANGKVPSAQLPSYVDDVLEFDAKANFPATGETGKIYVDKATNKTWRWGGTAYVEISSSLALGTTSSTAFRGDQGKIAYDHATAKGSAFTSGLYKITTNAQGHVTAAIAVQKADITALGIPSTNTTYSAATTSANGLMTKEMVTKLNGIATGATANAASSTTPKANGTAAVGSEVAFARGDHVHPLQTTVSGNAGSATKLQTARNINGVAFDGTKNITITANPITNTMTNQNLNDIKTPGFYNAGGSNTVTNKPSGVDAFGLIVYKTAGGYITQELTGGNNNPMHKYIRQFDSSTWSNWTEMKYTDNNTTYKAGTGISLSGTTFSNSGVRSIASGSANGTISVNTNGTTANVAVKGLGSWAYKSSGSYSDVGLGGAITNITRSGTTFTATKADGTTFTFTQQDNNTTYGNMGAATASAAGKAGLVPAPAAGKQASFLRGDGTWAVPTNTTYGVATTSANGLMSKEDKSKLNGITISNYLSKTNTTSYTPTADYHPSTKKYVDDAIKGAIGTALAASY